MVDINYWLDRGNAVLADAQTPTKAVDPFANLKAGETRTVGSFAGTKDNGITTIRGIGSPLGMMDVLRTQGYTPEQATQAVVGAAGAGLDNTNAALRPAESAASVAQTQANAGLIREQARIVAPESAARIAGINADIGLTNANAGRVGAETGALKRSQRVITATDDDARAAAAYRYLWGTMGSAPFFRLSQ